MELQRKVLDSHLQYTVGWLAPLPIERAAAEALLDEKHDQPRGFQQPENDPSSYSWGNIGQHNIVIASLRSGVYGTNTAATTASCMLSTFPSIRFGLLVGIGGGIARPDDGKDIRLGDIVVSAPGGSTGGVVNYDLMKAKANRKELKGFLNSPPPLLLHAVANLQSRHEQEPSAVPQILAELREQNPFMFKKRNNNPGFGYQGSENDRLFEPSYMHVGGRDCKKCSSQKEVAREPRDIPEEPEIHYGVIASGNTLVKDADEQQKLLNRISSLSDDCMCLEMEAAGLMNDFPCLVIRGICDYADSHKNDRWQRYAAATAAAFAKELLGVVLQRQVEEMRKATDVMKSLQDISTNVKELRQKSDEAQKEDRQKKIKDWLQPPDPSFDYQREKKRRGENTCLWLLDSPTFINWKNDTNNSFLWIHGIPGCGKTVLSTAVIRDLTETRKSKTHAVLYFFFAFGGKLKQTRDEMIRAFLFYLYRINEDVGKEIYQFFESVTREQPDARDLIILFWKVVAKFEYISIVLDGLDEVHEADHRKELLSWIKETVAFPGPHFHILVTSRDEEDISSALRGTGNMIHIDKSMVTPDIERHIDSEISKGELKKWEVIPEWQEKIKTTVSQRANGMFRLAACQIQELEACRDLKGLERCLKSLPRTLEETYNRILSRIPRELFEDAMILLQFLIYSDQALLVEDAIDLVSFGSATSTVELHKRMPDPKWIATYCRSLVTFHDTWSGDEVNFLSKEIRLAHFTVEEFLISKNVDQNFRLYFEEEKAIKSLFEVSISRIECLSSLECGTSGCDRQHPFAKRAAAYVMRHSRMFDQKDETFERFWNFLANEQAYKICIWHFRRRIDGEKMLIPSQVFTVARFGLLRSLQRFLEKGFCFVSQPVKALRAPFGFYKKRFFSDLSSSSNFSDKWEESENCHPLTPLYTAAAKGYRTIVRELLEHSFPVNDIGGPLGTALVVACYQGYHEVADDIIRAVPDTMTINYHDSLQAAAANGHLGTVRMLLSHGLHTNHAADQYGSAIYAASIGGNHEIVQTLLDESNAIPNIQEPPTKEYEFEMFNSDPSRPIWMFDLKVANVRSSKSLFGNALQVASALGHFRIVELLLQNGWSPNTVGGIFGSPLQAASIENHVRTIDILLRFHAEANIKGGYYGSAIEAAFVRSNQSVLKKLLRAGAIPTLERLHLDFTWNAGDETLIMLMIERLAQSGELADVGSSLDHLLSSERSTQSAEDSIYDSKPLLLRSVDYDWRLVGQELVKQGFQVSAQDEQGQTALHLAANKKVAEDARAWVEILAKGASASLALFQVDNNGGTLLHNFVLCYDFEMVERLMAILNPAGEKLPPTEVIQTAKDLLILKDAGQSVLHTAATQPEQRILKILLQTAKSLGIVQDLLLDENHAGRTPVWIAAELGKPQAIKTLIGFGADPRHGNRDGETPLHRMRRRSSLQPFPFGVRLPMTQPDSWDEDASSLISAVRLHHAVETNNPHLAEQIMEAEERCQDIVNSTDTESGKTPLHLAAENGSSNLVDLLLQPGWTADLNIKDNAGNVPLHYAVAGAHLEVSRILVDHGTRLDIANGEGQTPFDIAWQKEDGPLMQMVTDPDNDELISSAEDEDSFGYCSDSHSDESDNEEYGVDD